MERLQDDIRQERNARQALQATLQCERLEYKQTLEAAKRAAAIERVRLPHLAHGSRRKKKSLISA